MTLFRIWFFVRTYFDRKTFVVIQIWKWKMFLLNENEDWIRLGKLGDVRIDYSEETKVFSSTFIFIKSHFYDSIRVTNQVCLATNGCFREFVAALESSSEVGPSYFGPPNRRQARRSEPMRTERRDVWLDRDVRRRQRRRRRRGRLRCTRRTISRRRSSFGGLEFGYRYAERCPWKTMLKLF